MISALITQCEPADAAQILGALNIADQPLTIKAIAKITRDEPLAVANTLREIRANHQVVMLVNDGSNHYWPHDRPLPLKWISKTIVADAPHAVALMSQHDDPKDAAAPPQAQTPKAVTPAKAGAQVAQPSTGATMPTKKDKPLPPALADALEQLAKHPNGIKPRELGRLMSIDSSVISQRLAKLKARGLAKAIGRNWHATSPAATFEAKMPQTPRQQTTLKAPRKPSLETLDATLRNKGKLRAAGPAIIDGIKTRDLLDPSAPADEPDVSVAITDKHQLLIINGSQVEQIIKPDVARRVVAFLRMLTPDHPLALAS